ncbi:N-acetylmuramoyl-L-alanine amidase family protein [Deinococcus koreensis]|uniref:N-acetylmuramoyl-L-alanine amidase n=1 Tax=Deinococcus koreensis TaxID=2054903 RepID=A0A2K3UVF1_9DEIO|nr:N-acetylmuramoyl-L-alanine amidase [Deinococcus koreensis]PNY80508.1 N-acetylmuramoyl-L-alanine amidase [Deinococcus koreensis]
MLALPLLLLTLLTPPVEAAPRVGTHDGYTRLVFDLPQGAQAQKAQPSVSIAGQSVTVRLPLTLKAEQGALKAPGVTAYAVAGGTVTVTFAQGYRRAKASVLPASGGQKARLIVDVLTDAASRVAASSPSAPVSRPTSRPVTRPASTATVQRPRVVLDPGHGGIDPGMGSRWVTEEDVTLDVALRTRAELVRHGVDVVMTRASDRHLSTSKSRDLDMRSKMASNGTVSAFVSIHVNAAGASAQGIETYYFGKPLAGSNRSLAVAENGGGSVGEELTRRAANTAQSLLGDILAQAKLTFSRDLARRVQSSLVSSTGAVNRGVQTDAFYVIRNPTTPAILVEVGFGTHPVEGPKLATAAYRERLAQGLARAILDFLHTD